MGLYLRPFVLGRGKPYFAGATNADWRSRG
jgi:hypothetical protein